LSFSLGVKKNKRYIIEEKLTIGRHADNEIQINDAAVSRYHAEIKRTALGTYIQDLGSSNST